MKTMQQRLQTIVPQSLRTRPRDARGYPIPFIVLIDQLGQPHFTVNDQRRVRDCINKKLCALCGKRLSGGCWFAAGAVPFLKETGIFIDPPGHYGCLVYALQVCPFLAAPSYAKRVGLATLTPEGLSAEMMTVSDHDAPPEQPKIFGLGHTFNYRLVPVHEDPRLIHKVISYHAVDTWTYVEFWRHGEPVNAPTAAEMADGLL